MRLKVDGQEVIVPPGTTVKDAAKSAGVLIPGLCDHPDLEPYGGCRLCLVQIDGIRGYPSSCTTPATEGMVVKTDTEDLKKLRINILEMLLSEHPSICLTCERSGKCDDIRECMRKVPQTIGCRYCPKDGRCELEAVVEQIGLKEIRLSHLGQIKDVVHSPFFDRDPNLCILCGRCIRACLDRGLGVISFIFRGFEAGIGTAFEKPLEEAGCRFCGACVDVCPTGALVERAGKWAGIPDETVVTICPYCGSNCRIELDVLDGRILRARPHKSKLCVRGRFSWEFLNRERLKRPLIRKDGKLVEVSIEEALEFAANGLYKHKNGKLALFTSGILNNEALFVAWKFASSVMLSPVVAPDVASVDGILSDLPDPLVVVGNLGQTNPATELAIRSRMPIVVSPISTILADHSSLWLMPRPGEEALLLRAIASIFKGKKPAILSVSSELIETAAKNLENCSIIVGPDCGPDVRATARELAKASSGRVHFVGKNCNSRAVMALGLNLDYGRVQSALLSGELDAAYFVGSNPARDNPELARCMNDLDFIVVQDLFLTETASLADVVLPASGFAEVDGTMLGSQLEMMPTAKARAPVGKPDWWLLADLARRMGAVGFDYQNLKAIQEEMAAVIKNRRSRALPDRFFKRTLSKGMPLLLRGAGLFEFGSGTRTSKVFDIEYLTREKKVDINPGYAKEIGINSGDPVRIDSKGGGIKAIARTSSRIPPGVLHVAGTKLDVEGVKVSRDV